MAERITTLRCSYKDVLSKLMNLKELKSFAAPDVLIGCDVLLSESDVEELAKVMQVLLRSPKQVAYVMDPYTRPYRKKFMRPGKSMARVRFLPHFRYILSG